mgnify:CR=1 FL=1
MKYTKQERDNFTPREMAVWTATLVQLSTKSGKVRNNIECADDLIYVMRLEEAVPS